MSTHFDTGYTATVAPDAAEPSDATATAGTGTCDRCHATGPVRTEHGLGYAYAALCGPWVRDLPAEPKRTPLAEPPAYEPPPRLTEQCMDASRPVPFDHLRREPGPPTYTPPPRIVALCWHCGLAFTPEHELPHWSDGYTASWDLTAVPEVLRAPPPSGSRDG